MTRLLAIVLLSLSAFAGAEVPQVVRDTVHDWRCVDADFNLISNHQRQDKAIVSCQEQAESNPGETFYIEGGRYRVSVEAPDPVPDPDPIPDPDPVPDPDPGPDPGPPATGDNADRINAILGNYTVPFAYNTPAEPVTTSNCAAGSAAAFNACASNAGTLITVTNSFSGNIRISANDIDVVMENGDTINGLLTMDPGYALSRIRWTGGNIDAGGQLQTWRGIADLMLDDLHMRGRVDLHRISGMRGCERVAIINSTLDTRGASGFIDFTLYSHNDTSTRHEDLIIANVAAHNGANSPIRIQAATRVIVVESAFNPENSSDTGFRFSSGTNQALVAGRAGKPTYIVGRIHLTYTSPTNTAVTNVTWDNVVQYRDFNQAFLHLSVPNSGVVRNYTLHSGSGAGGQLGGLAPFSDGGGNTVLGWNGQSLPDASAYGAQR